MKKSLSAVLLLGLVIGCGPLDNGVDSPEGPAIESSDTTISAGDSPVVTDDEEQTISEVETPKKGTEVTAGDVEESPTTTATDPNEMVKADESTAEEPATPATKKEVEVPTEYNPLTPEEAYVILNKGTERAWVGEYTDTEDPGTYICRRCNAALYQADSKFHSNCGWPAFDDEIKGAVDRLPDADGFRTEIICHNCGGHLGHVFLGEGFTEKNTRHCVNSISMKFIPKGKELPPVIKKKEETK